MCTQVWNVHFWNFWLTKIDSKRGKKTKKESNLIIFFQLLSNRAIFELTIIF